MPIIKELHFGLDTRLALWKIEERENDLIQRIDLPILEKQKFEMKKKRTHRLGFLSSRASLVALGVNLNALQFNQNGMPYLGLKKNCSISHTFNYAAAVVSSEKVGVDVEMYRFNISKITSKFVHDDEKFIQNSSQKTEFLTRLWTAKEAIYKAINTPGISFSKQIKVSPFSLDDTQGSATVNHLGNIYSFYLYYTSLNDGQLCLAKKK